MFNQVMIVGTGNVGASIGYALLNQRTAVNELILVDKNRADAEGEAIDLSDCLALAPSYFKIRSGTFADARDCDIVVLTAGVPQQPGETRLQLLKSNAAIFKSIISEIMQSGFSGIFLVVTNPMDVLSYLTWKYSGLPSDQVIGSGTVLDTSRLRYALARRLSVHPKSVHAYQIGEHGDTEFALWSLADLGGQPLTQILRPAELDQLESSARNAAYDIINKKGATYYGIGASVARIINCILADERRVLPVSSYDDFADVYNGFPAVVGRQGIIRRLHLDLSESEKLRLQHSNNTLRSAIDSVDH